ncbi:Acetylcholinesterase [Drechslerella dactyloides]|uniref:Acetylcholinesterase n=1 Tax=Drechslerella dactyloides TaxID=74499 RepID=A0AAD6NIX0_DREDA|nr:Acetylcholinesterase [Drechslerella dactyloides]
MELSASLLVLLGTLLSLLQAAVAAPIAAPDTNIGIGIDFTPGSDLPLLKLPYATYRASEYNVLGDFYKFSNIRFAAPPVGALRWQKPAPPLQEEGIQLGDVGYQCMQATPAFLSIAYPIITSEPQSEDCLFLDVYVPSAAIRGRAKNLPVMFWIYGGGYALGAKDFFIYNGAPLMKSAQNNMIYVAPNYRMGAYGFLAGPTVEKNGVPNAGLWDQRAALQWVQDYIGLVGGDKNAVTAMGESAGGGSITHHLVGNGGTLNPLFKRAIIQSPAWLPQFDGGQLETQYASFEARAGCAGKGLECLRGKSLQVIDEANRGVIASQDHGRFGFGPAVDNSFIRDLPNLEFAKGNYWKDLDSVMVGHTSNEGYIFTDPAATTDQDVYTTVSTTFSNATRSTIDKMLNLYPTPGLFKKYLTNFLRGADLVGQFIVTCNTRTIAQAYPGKTYNYQFSVVPGLHAEDILFTFWHPGIKLGPIELDFNLDFLTSKNLATGWQSYLTSFVRSGNPNTYRESGGLPWTVNWDKSRVGDTVSALNMDLLGFSMIGDPDTDAGRCGFWQSNVWTGRS